MTDIAVRLRQGIDPYNLPEAEKAMDKASAEIGRLRSAVRINGIRAGFSDAEIDAVIYHKDSEYEE